MTYRTENSEHNHCDHGCQEYPGQALGMTEFASDCADFDNLIAGDFPQVIRVATITGGDILPRGAVLGRIHHDDNCEGDRYKFVSESSCKDGSAMPDAILAQTVDTRDGDKEAYIYLAGEFNQDAVILPCDQDKEEVTHILRKRSIFLRKVG